MSEVCAYKCMYVFSCWLIACLIHCVQARESFYVNVDVIKDQLLYSCIIVYYFLSRVLVHLWL